MEYQWLFLGVLLYIGRTTLAGRVLITATVTSHSHSMWCNKLAEVLIRRGHQVTIIDTEKKQNVVNIIKYSLDASYEMVKDLDYQEIAKQTSPLYSTDFVMDYFNSTCTENMKHPVFKKFMEDHSGKKNYFDLMIHDMTTCENFLGLMHVLEIPKLISVTPFGEPTNVLYIMNDLQNLVHGPFHLSSFTHPMSVDEKIKNLIYNLYYLYKYHQHLDKMDVISKEYFGSSTPHVLEIARRSSLALINAHPVADGAKYFSPAIIPVAGLQADEPSKLDEKTQAFLDEAKDGVIIFSLGSTFLGKYMSEDKINMFLNVFKNLKQKVLWKFEGNLTNVPKNVMISKWLRHNDVLAHPNIRFIIYHMGLMGTQEAIYHGVPMIGMPLIVDQHVLIKRLERKGVALFLSYSDLTQELLMDKIQEMLNNPSYGNKMKKWSNLFKDRLTTPKELASYWVEYVLNNDDLEFLKPPESFLTIFELFFFDIRTFVCIIIGFLISIFVEILRSCKGMFRKKKVKTN